MSEFIDRHFCSECEHEHANCTCELPNAKVRVGSNVRCDEAEIAALRAALERAEAERDEARRLLGGGCDANDGGDHTVIRQKNYAFCAKCGESLKGTRFCHEPRALQGGDKP